METTFVYSKYVTGKHFIGRRNDVTVLSNLLARYEHVVLIAPPKTGKMSAIQQTLYEMRLAHKNFQVAVVSLLSVRDLPSFVKQFGDSLLRAVASTEQEYAELIRTCLPGTHFIFDPERYEHAGEILSLNWDLDRADILSLLRLPYRLAEARETPLITLVNDFQNLDFLDDPDAFFKDFEEVVREASALPQRPPVSFVFLGSRVNAMRDIFFHRHHFHRLVTSYTLSPIDEREIKDAVQRAFMLSGKVIDADLMLAVCRRFRNNIWYITHFMAICDRLSKGYIMESVLTEAFQMQLSLHEPRFIEMMDGLTNFQVRLLRAVIDGYTRFSSAEVIQAYDLHSSANVKRLKEALMKKEILTFDDNDEPVILDPLFEYWVTTRYFQISD